MSRILESAPAPAVRPRHVVITREDHQIWPEQPRESCHPYRPWGELHMPERVATHEPPVETRASGGRRQHQPRINNRRMYSPQDQSQVHPRFLILDRVSGQVLARVRGTVNHVKSEASALAKSQGGKLSDLIIRIEGEFA